MVRPSRRALFQVFLAASIFLLPSALFAQTNASVVASRITQPIDESKLVTLKGNTHPLARPEFDQGAAPDNQPMNRALLLLQRSPDQEADLRQLLDQQQSNSSPNFHQWLTPAEFGQQFGPSDADIGTITSWLQSHGFTVNRVSAGRTVIEISGTAGQIRGAFHTEIHKYVVNGQSHWANASDPEIPAALAPVVTGFASLNDFPDQAENHVMGKVLPSHSVDQPELSGQCENSSGVSFNCYAVTPYDFATIYNVLPLWNGAGGPVIDGTGQTIAIVAESDICTVGSPDFITTSCVNGSVDSVNAYRSAFGLPTTLPSGGAPVQVIVAGSNPGIVAGAETEADLDVAVAGAVAKNAQIDLVVAGSTETTGGDFLAEEYIVSNNLAPVMNVSFGNCEANLGTGGNAFFNALWEQAAAQGISVSVAAGDSGSAGCDADDAPQAQSGRAVSGVASTPFNVALGGTDFNDAATAATYWCPPGEFYSNGQCSSAASSTLSSAKGYIPEIPWNLSCATGGLQACSGLSENSASLNVVAGGGGQSSLYPKPVWQNGPEIAGAPATDRTRDIPDVSLFSSVGSASDAAWIICDPFAGNPVFSISCSLSSGAGYILVGGTSASAPAFAGIMALVNQYMSSQGASVPGQGNPNYALYYLAAEETYSGCASAAIPVVANSTCTFYDLTSGNNSVPCAGGSPNCSATAGGATGVIVDANGNPAWEAGSGYDLATGLGSINVTNLVHNWTSFKRTAPTVVLQLNGGAQVNITHGAFVPVSITVAPSSPLPTGDASLLATQGSGTTGFGTFTLSNGSASGTTNFLPGGSSYTVQAHYAGDVHYSSADSNAVTVGSVNPEPSAIAIAVTTYSVNLTTGAVTAQPNVTSFPYGSLYTIRIGVTNNSGNACVNSTNVPFAYPCPTGTVTYTDNGSVLTPSLFPSPAPLNAQGFTEVPGLQEEIEDGCPGCSLGGGPQTLSAAYSGDNSYSAGSGSATITVTPAPTTIAFDSVETNDYSIPSQDVVIGQSFWVNFDVQSNSWGTWPQGTFSLFDGGTQVYGPEIAGGDVVSGGGAASFSGSVSAEVAGPAGPHTLTLRYNGNIVYAPSVSNSFSTYEYYPDTVAVSASPNLIVQGSGTSVTLTAIVDTTNPASNAALRPTGTVSFQGLSGPVNTSVMQDSTGNWELQATTTFAPQQSALVFAFYSGDTNYAASESEQGGSVSVTSPDFSITAGPAPQPITAGQTGTFTFTITPLTAYASSVTPSCTVASAYPLANVPCNFSPSTVSLNNGVPVVVTLSLPVPPPSSVLTAMVAPRRERLLRFLSPDRLAWWGFSVLALMTAAILVLPGRRRSLRTAFALASAAFLSFAIGCGGGGGSSASGGGGGGGGGGGSVATTTTLTTTSVKVPANSSVTLTANVTPASATGTVCLFADYDSFDDCPTPLVNGTAQLQYSGQGIGTHFVQAQFRPGGNAVASASGQLSIVFTGSDSLTICAVTGLTEHCMAPMTITIQ